MIKAERFKGLEEKIGYSFTNKRLLALAMTHSSYANEQRGRRKANNERLEFLGDAVLEVTISDYVFREYPSYNEGRLTKLRSSLVCEYTLAICARDVELGKYILLSRGEDATGGRGRDSILSDAFEALIGAIYIDGGMDKARFFIHNHLLKDVEDKSLFYDAKTILQEMVQAGPDSRLQYVLTREAGPDHAKEFTVETRIGGKTYAIGKGKTKKGAEQIAAYQTILLLKKQRV